MKVGLNLLYLIPGVVGGTQTYAVELMKALADLPGDDDYVVYLNREASRLDLQIPERFEVRRCPVPGSSRGLRYLYEQTVLPVLLARDRVDVVHSLGYVSPLLTRCPRVVTIHDLIYRGYRDFMSPLRRVVLEVMVKASARRADRVLTLSEHSRAEIAADTGVPADRIEVVHPGGLGERSGAGRTPSARPYVIALGSRSGSKNIPRLVAAFALVADRVEADLVVAGAVADIDEVKAAIAAGDVEDRVRLTGYVDRHELIDLVAGADLLAFPSLFEGFGLPVVEAQELGVPVAASRAGPLPEVGGDAAAYFDPTDVEDIARVLVEVLGDPERRAGMAAAGRTNAARFSWPAAARATSAAYRAAAKESR
jgi:glycosyltransferase involved in cell wall biosynthesis